MPISSCGAEQSQDEISLSPVQALSYLLDALRRTPKCNRCFVLEHSRQYINEQRNRDVSTDTKCGIIQETKLEYSTWKVCSPVQPTHNLRRALESHMYPGRHSRTQSDLYENCS